MSWLDSENCSGRAGAVGLSGRVERGQRISSARRRNQMHAAGRENRNKGSVRGKSRPDFDR